MERKTVKAGDSQLIMEISAWLEKGANDIVITAKKNTDGGRRSVSTADKAALVIGAGHEEGTIVKLDVVHVKLKVNASQVIDLEKRSTLNAI